MRSIPLPSIGCRFSPSILDLRSVAGRFQNCASLKQAAHSTQLMEAKKKGKTPTPTDEDSDSVPEAQSGLMLDRGQMKPYKVCAACHKPMTMRSKWKDSWDSVKFCSERCRREAKQARRSRGQPDPEAGSDG